MPRRVLIVDDDESVRTMLRVRLALEPDTIEVREAGDGVDALRIVADYRPDVVVLDFTMPEMNGAETAVAIRKLYPDVHIVVFSGVIHETPDWADAHVTKGSAPDLERVVSKTRVA